MLPPWDLRLQATVTFVCDPTALGFGVVRPAIGFDTQALCNLNFTWLTAFACEVAPPAPPPGPKDPDGRQGLGATTWLLLLAGLVCAAYCAVGFLYRSRKLGKPWPESMPNYEFWRTVPTRVNDGVQFVLSGGKGGGGGAGDGRGPPGHTSGAREETAGFVIAKDEI
eukprot:SAG22_NODE_1512_length_4256_cov_2.793120_2_plen_167_part_00